MFTFCACSASCVCSQLPDKRLGVDPAPDLPRSCPSSNILQYGLYVFSTHLYKYYLQFTNIFREMHVERKLHKVGVFTKITLHIYNTLHKHLFHTCPPPHSLILLRRGTHAWNKCLWYTGIVLNSKVDEIKFYMNLSTAINLYLESQERVFFNNNSNPSDILPVP